MTNIEDWAKAYRQLLSDVEAGEVPKLDMYKVRPAGVKLKTFGKNRNLTEEQQSRRLQKALRVLEKGV
jgi:hypothetical protein